MKANLFRWLCVAAVLACSSGASADTVIYSEGFESDDAGYVHSGANDTWERGTPLATFTDGPQAAHSGVSCWGTNLSGEVPDESDATLTSPAISLPAVSDGQTVRVRFFGWLAVDFMYDRADFMVSRDGVTWETKSKLYYRMTGGWTEYSFDITDYAGGTVYLRFRAFTDNEDSFDPPQLPYNMAGFYVDDIAIRVADNPGPKTVLTFAGWENPSSVASCPWVFSWNGSEYVKDNDVFSTARGASAEYTDYYKLANAPVADPDGNYRLQIAETEQEQSFIDLTRLMVIDHEPGARVANDELGNIHTYTTPQAPLSAVDGSGADVARLIRMDDGQGVRVYDGDSVELDFQNVAIADKAVLVLVATGFLSDGTAARPTGTPQPKIEVQTHDAAGSWVTRNRFFPRWKQAVNTYELGRYFVTDRKVRLVSRSCHSNKYHLINYVGLDVSPARPFTATSLSPTSALKTGSEDVLAQIATEDGQYASLDTTQSISLLFAQPVQDPSTVRDFVIVSRGYYIPSGTFFFYTWDGSAWVQHDGWSIVENGIQSRSFDLSLWLPDPSGEYKVRIWQDFIFDPAGIDFVGLTREGVTGTMTYATDLMQSASILDAVSALDGRTFDWDWGISWPDRNRWVEIAWTGFPEIHPPTTAPVSVSNTGSPTPTLSWVYASQDGKPQEMAEVEIWTGPGGTGANVWDPDLLSGAQTSVVFDGTPLVVGETYYGRVRASDGSSWGPWSEAAFVLTENHAPQVEAGGDLTTDAGVAAVFEGSYLDQDPNDAHTVEWDFGDGSTNASGTLTPSHVYAAAGSYVVTLTVTDQSGGVGTDTLSVTVSGGGSCPHPRHKHHCCCHDRCGHCKHCHGRCCHHGHEPGCRCHMPGGRGKCGHHGQCQHHRQCHRPVKKHSCARGH